MTLSDILCERRTLSRNELSNDDYFRFFAARVCEFVPSGAAVLDVGCGNQLHEAYQPIRAAASLYWGCDPDPKAAKNEALDRYFHGELEYCDLGGQRFDLIIATYVLEHLKTPEVFFAKVRNLLNDGGIFAFLTPNGRHPFCRCVRVCETLQLKSAMRRLYGTTSGDRWRINDYPALYRANTANRIEQLARAAGFRSSSAIFVPSGWKYYFPRGLRFVPELYDRVAAPMLPEGHLILLGFLTA